eukprot:4760264-Alexandrium_andersonii.AAC.1
MNGEPARSFTRGAAFRVQRPVRRLAQSEPLERSAERVRARSGLFAVGTTRHEQHPVCNTGIPPLKPPLYEGLLVRFNLRVG